MNIKLITALKPTFWLLLFYIKHSQGVKNDIQKKVFS